jgi:hypothetical protein
MEASMHEYEIRILRADKSTATVIEVMHLNDNAAIRSARVTANGNPFEVWRGLDCVYGRDYPSQRAAPPPPGPQP